MYDKLRHRQREAAWAAAAGGVIEGSYRKDASHRTPVDRFSELDCGTTKNDASEKTDRLVQGRL